ncbi:hypothetical protein NUSPORA_00336 [Nucleospora cyclopteri]
MSEKCVDQEISDDSTQTQCFNCSTSEEARETNEKTHEFNVAEYEKSTLIRIFRMQADKKTAEVKKKIQKCNSTDKMITLYGEIDRIESELEEKIKELENPRTENEIETSNVEYKKDIIYNTIKIDHNLYNYLFDHQKTGLKWMIDLFLQNKGGVLADEMGMGKTLQVIALIVTLIKNKLISKILILSPATVIHIWEQEIKTVLTKTKSNSSFYLEKITILSYGLFLSRNKKYIEINSKKEISNQNMIYDCVFLDEGHKIKNKDALISKLCKKIKCNVNFVVSGTPIQNNLTELWSIFDFVQPNLLGSCTDFGEEFIENIKGNDEKAYRYSLMLRSIIEPYILRRMKSQIEAQLPSKLDKVLFCTLTQIQNNIYLKLINKIRATSKNLTSETIFKQIDLLRKVCNHPYLINKKLYDSSFADIITSSAKTVALIKFLRKWKKGGNKVLIFTQTVQMQNILESAIINCGREYSYLILNGNVDLKKRTDLIKRFNEDKNIFCFLLTTRVGGLGLNLVGADRIVIYDPDWNPSIDAQAKERIYRYGQKSSVEIYRLICRNTVEEKIYQKQIYKDCLSKRVLLNPKAFLQKEVMDLFSYGIPLENDPAIEIDKNYSVEKDHFKVHQEDQKEFEKMKENNTKRVLTGKELKSFILTREKSLKE